MPRIKGQNKIDRDPEYFKQCVMRACGFADLMRLLGYKPSGGINVMLKEKINQYGLDISHFEKKSWNKGKNAKTDPRIKQWRVLTNAEIFSLNGVVVKNGHKLKRLVLDYGWEYKCCICSLANWQGKPLRLHLDHINGNDRDNRIENLRILCPNCHSQTPTFSVGDRVGVDGVSQIQGEKRYHWWWKDASMKLEIQSKIRTMPKPKENKPKRQRRKSDEINKLCMCCGLSCSGRSKSKMCKKCYLANNPRRTIPRPDAHVLLAEVIAGGYLATGRKYGVSGNAIKKWLKRFGIIPPRRRKCRGDETGSTFTAENRKG